MSETCVVPRCKSGREASETPIAFFGIPRNPELRDKWTAAIPTAGVPLNPTGAICEKHFREPDVIRHYVIQDGTENVGLKVAYDNPRLTETAVPSIFPDNQQEWTRPNVMSVRQPGSPNTSDVVSQITEGRNTEARPLIGRNDSDPPDYAEACGANARNGATEPTKPIGFERFSLPITTQPLPTTITPTTGFPPTNDGRRNDDNCCYCCNAFCDDLGECCCCCKCCRCRCCNERCLDWLECCAECCRCLGACAQLLRVVG